MKKTLVIAGNSQQFRIWCRSNGRTVHNTIYASHVNDIRGLRGVEIVETGSYWKNPVYCSDEYKYLLRTNIAQ